MARYYAPPPDPATLLHNLASLVAYFLKAKITVHIDEGAKGESVFTSDYKINTAELPQANERRPSSMAVEVTTPAAEAPVAELVSIAVGGSTHTRTAQEWLDLSRTTLSRQPSEEAVNLAELVLELNDRGIDDWKDRTRRLAREFLRLAGKEKP